MPDSWANSGLDLHLGVTGRRLRAGLESALREAIRGGRLAPGTRLPASRQLAADLGLARNTVADAYAQLVAEGWLAARQGAGTWVARGGLAATAGRRPRRRSGARAPVRPPARHPGPVRVPAAGLAGRRPPGARGGARGGSRVR